MAPTPVLAHLPYTRQVLAGLGTTIGRTRFMRIAHETELHAHVDTNYYWWHHLRVHVPIVTTPDVVFEVGGARLWDLIDDPDREPRMIEFASDVTPLLPLETVSHPVVMPPSEVDATLDALLDDPSPACPPRPVGERPRPDLDGPAPGRPARLACRRSSRSGAGTPHLEHWPDGTDSVG